MDRKSTQKKTQISKSQQKISQKTNSVYKYTQTQQTTDLNKKIHM